MHYFQAHPIVVYREFLLMNMLMKEDLYGRFPKWVAKVREFDIEFLLIIAIKGQGLANFIAEFLPWIYEFETGLPDGRELDRNISYGRDNTWGS